jgi:hypothetical protein
VPAYEAFGVFCYTARQAQRIEETVMLRKLWENYAWVYLVIAVCALTVRLATYDRYLPHIDYSDEVNYVALGLDARGLSDQTALKETYGLIAPFYVWFNVVVQSIHDAFNTQRYIVPADYYVWLRLTSVVFGVLTALTIAWLAWQLSSPAAALLAGLVWGLSPIIVELNSLTIPDPPLYFVCILAVTAAAFAWKQHSVRWLAVSLALGIVALYLKLWVVTALLPFFVASAGLFLEDRQRMLRPLFILYGIGVAFGLHFMLIMNPLSNTFKVNDQWESGSFLGNLFIPDRLFNNLWHMVYPADGGTGLFWVVAGGGTIAYLYARRNRSKILDGRTLIITIIYLVATTWLTMGISYVNIDSAGRMRHILPVSTAAIALGAALVVQLGWSLQHWLGQRRYGESPAVLMAGTVVVLLFLLPGFITDNLTLVQRFQREHTANVASAWFDGSPPRDGLVLLEGDTPYGALWERIWGAYAGSKPYDYWWTVRDEIALQTPAEYLERNIQWLVLSHSDDEPSGEAATLQAYLDDLLLVKTIDAEEGSRAGDTLYIYRFANPDYSSDAAFGDTLRLVGYDLTDTTIAVGETLAFRPYWRLVQPTANNLTMFVHLYSAQSVADGMPELLAQVDTPPLHNADRPTATWTDLDEVYFANSFLLTIPETLSEGDHIFATGLYDVLTGQRLLLDDGASFYPIPLRVVR